MSNDNFVGVPYLEMEDLNEDGSLKPHVCNNTPVIVMLQGGFCGFCRRAKPDFQAAYNQLRNRVRLATAQTDLKGEESVQRAGRFLMNVSKSDGVPAYLVYDKNGKFRGKYEGDRSKGAIIEFAKNL